MKGAITVILLSLSIAQSTVMECDKTKTVGPYKLQVPETPLKDVTEYSTIASVAVYPKSIKGTLAYRFKYTAHCYTKSGGSQDCTTHLVDVFPSHVEVVEWNKKGKCFVGESCPPTGSCWGAWAPKCMEKEVIFPYEGYNFFRFSSPPSPNPWYHSCTKDWKCNFHKGEYPLYVSLNGTHPILTTSDQYGKNIVLNKETLTEGYKKDKEYVVFFEADNIAPEVVTTYPQCLGASYDEIVCSVSHPKIEDGNRVVFRIDPSTKSGSIRNTLMVVTGSIRYVDNSTVKEIAGNDNRNVKHPLLRKGSAPDIESLLIEMNTLKASSLQSIYNDEIIVEDISNVKRLLVRMIESISKIDDELLSSVTGFIGRSKFVSSDIFIFRPCLSQWNSPFSNCDGAFKLNHGRATMTNGKGEGCYSISSGAIQPIGIFDQERIITTRYEVPVPHSYSGGWDSWSWYIDEMTKTPEMDFNTGMGSASSNESSFLDGNWLLSPFLQWFHSASSIIGWVSLVLHFVRRR
jgi:hypothetical protein